MVGKGLSRRRVLEAGLRLLDAEGLEALTMRRLGGTLGVDAMSLYRHVPDKAALLEGICELAWEEMPLGREDGRAGWEARIKRFARAFRQLALAHPRLFPLLATSPRHARGAMGHIEATLATLRKAGFSRRRAAEVFDALVGYVYGYCLREIAGLQAGRDGRERVWFETGELPRESFPHLVDLAPYFVQPNTGRAYERGLDAMLLGLRRELETLRAEPGGQPATSHQRRSPPGP